VTETTDAVIAVDIGGTKIAVARIEKGSIVERRQIATPRTGRGDDLADAVAETVRLITPLAHRLGVATTGIIDKGCLTALNPGTLPVENNYPLVLALKKRLGIEALAVNDAQAAAFHESRQTNGKASRRLAFITVSTGIGAGFVLDGILQTGRHGLAGHAGHIVVDPHGPLCGCGRRGCVETIASGTAIAQRASEITGDAMTTPEVFEAARRGDEKCAQVLEGAAQALSVMIADLVATLDLDIVRLGGGVGMQAAFLHRLGIAMGQLPAIYCRPVEAALGGADAGLLGVAILFGENFLHK